ncbi:TetR/AcrR family transcriptional regulator [Streptomyces sp. N2-109]|uniref:TetR/AcrR family transcriptional regulator n=1 Tax=Streptomyces gossypii TaxID=2883101 RepID=A0ABT2JRH0_9ACTN|nr:TetR/AcrR family transcriptional regulator [Streptomyces gossypii]MCT2590089.1 TetR/AcrR family transcriptional regulator [Streptomyces gossypii]
MTTTPTTGARRRMGVEERRQQLIAVALELFSRRSPEDVSIDDIASAAGISRPLVYHYFPGKHSLYEEAVRRAAEELASRFAEPQEGPLSERLLRVMRRYFDFVSDHGPGFSALLRGGPAVGSAEANAMIDDVRQAAHAQVLAHLGIAEPGPRLALVVRSWVGLAETTALTWLDGRSLPREELEIQLVHDFLALAAVTAMQDAETAGVVRAVLAQEPADGPIDGLVSEVLALAPRRVPVPGPV